MEGVEAIDLIGDSDEDEGSDEDEDSDEADDED